VNGADQQYDDNGDPSTALRAGMTLRVVDGVTYTQTWDAENRLIQVVSGTQTTSFTYDADGALVKKVVDGEATVYPSASLRAGVGNYYEENLASGEATIYYYHNGQRVAMRRIVPGEQDVVYFLTGDHLGTTSLILNADDTLHSEARHYPYGQERWSAGTLTTDYRFTGQRLDSYIKLTVMGARWYDGQLGRWISPDPIIPDPANPQSFNRYSYVYNRPLVFVDRDGHFPWPVVVVVIGAVVILLRPPLRDLDDTIWRLSLRAVQGQARRTG
jgi:RHS repeat-associated protein